MSQPPRVVGVRHLAAIALAVVGTSCGSGAVGPTGDSSPRPALTVAAAIYPIEEVVSRVGGDDVRVLALTPPGEDPHDRDLTAKQLDALSDADIVFYLGEGFQPGVEKAVDSLRGVVKIDLLESVTLLDAPDSNGHDSHAHGEHDPHIWLDPANMVAMSREVARVISDADPSLTARIQANLGSWVSDLDALGSDIDSSLSRCDSRALVTAHNAFGYLAHRARLDTYSISGLNPGEEPSAKELESLESVIRGRGVTVVYYETLLPGDVARTIADAVGVDTDLLDPVENISSSDRKAGATYLTIQRANLARLVKGLRCS